MKKNSAPILLTALFLLASIALSPALDVTARYFRFTQTKLRGAGANSIQLAEFDMIRLGARIPGAIATNPGGNNPAGEMPLLVVDGLTATKWLDFNKLALVLDYSVPVTADGYRFCTANDATDRDPVSWTIEWSNDDVTYNLIETKDDFATTTARFTYTPDLLFLAPTPLQIIDFSTDRPKIGSGESATLSWTVGGSTSVSINQGIGAVDEIGTAPITPAAETTYTLTAMKGAQTVTKQVTVKVIPVGTHTYQYFQFRPLLLRGAGANSIQLAEFEMLKDGVAVPGAVASNPAGNNPANETPDLAVDGNTATKWLDFNKGPLMLDFTAPVAANGYRFATANDADERDPVDWVVEGSTDGSVWVQLDSVASFPTPTARFTYTGNVPLPTVVPPIIAAFTADPVHLLPGETTTLTWDTELANTVLIAPAVPNGSDKDGTVVLTPAAPVTWTLTATNAAGTLNRTAQVHVEGPARQVTWKFFRFTPTDLRNFVGANSVQISEFELSLNGQPVAGATATNPNGSNPANETPDLAVDGSTGTKWLDFMKGPLMLEFPDAVTIDAYRIGTANDAPERDPTAWTFEGSADGTNWTLIDTRNMGFVVPALRFTYTNYFHFAGATPKNLIQVQQITYNKTNQTATLTWNSEAAFTYRIERSSNLEAWETALDNVASGGETTSQTVSTTGLSKVFFQVVRKPL